MSVLSTLQPVVALFFEPKEPTLTQLSREAMKALLAENEALIKACADQRESLVAAYSNPQVTTPEERPSSGFIMRRRLAEERTSTSFQKFFTE